jgi:ankyrin repeat protein
MEYGNVEMASLLLRHGADINLEDDVSILFYL